MFICSLAYAGNVSNSKNAQEPGEPGYGVIRGKLKQIDPTTFECRRRKYACGWVVIQEGMQPSYAFPSDYTGPYPEGTFLNDEGYMENPNVTFTETVEGEEEVTYINFN